MTNVCIIGEAKVCTLYFIDSGVPIDVAIKKPSKHSTSELEKKFCSTVGLNTSSSSEDILKVN